MILDVDDYRNLEAVPIQADPAEWTVLGVITVLILVSMTAALNSIGEAIDVASESAMRYEVPVRDLPPPPSPGTISCDCRVVP